MADEPKRPTVTAEDRAAILKAQRDQFAQQSESLRAWAAVLESPEYAALVQSPQWKAWQSNGPKVQKAIDDAKKLMDEAAKRMGCQIDPQTVECVVPPPATTQTGQM